MARSIRLPIDGMRDAQLQLSRRIRESKLVIPVQSVADLLNDAVDVTFVDVEGVDGNTTLLEQVIILALARRHGAQRVFEFGTFDGRTTANLAVNLPLAEIHTIDLPVEQMASTKFAISRADVQYVRKDLIGAKSLGAENVIQLQGDTATFDFRPWYGTRDFVFVDACHEYEYVRNDTEIALRLLMKDGIVMWHDYGSWTGVTRALNEFYLKDARFLGIRHIRNTSLCWAKM
jgi:hypothetical protein